jgi:hypothetical protein
MSERYRFNVGSLAGVLGFLIPAASNALIPIWQFPGTSASGTRVAGFVTQHQDALRGVAVLDTLGVTLWMVFGAAVWIRLRRSSGVDTLATTVFGVAFGGMVVLLWTGFTVFFVLVYRLPDPTTARVLYDLTFALLAMSGMPTAIALTAYAAVVLPSTHLPRHTAGLAIFTAAAHVLLLLSLVTPHGPLSLEGPLITVMPGLLFAWILTVALTLGRPDWIKPAA